MPGRHNESTYRRSSWEHTACNITSFSTAWEGKEGDDEGDRDGDTWSRTAVSTRVERRRGAGALCRGRGSQAEAAAPMSEEVSLAGGHKVSSSERGAERSWQQTGHCHCQRRRERERAQLSGEGRGVSALGVSPCCSCLLFFCITCTTRHRPQTSPPRPPRGIWSLVWSQLTDSL